MDTGSLSSEGYGATDPHVIVYLECYSQRNWAVLAKLPLKPNADDVGDTNPPLPVDPMDVDGDNDKGKGKQRLDVIEEANAPTFLVANLLALKDKGLEAFTSWDTLTANIQYTESISLREFALPIRQVVQLQSASVSIRSPTLPPVGVTDPSTLSIPPRQLPDLTTDTRLSSYSSSTHTSPYNSPYNLA
ncbi:hypothetical protein BDV39DRAFT_199087 [Aspergillus sergii]|uniref:Uncharacterized protein n=1 Tax=Aspergillus sergii TaxID=1034303 RepID=A0A5N6XJD8_9EURO|nr:hypothetical protein BDV39DRAFT_199087 [Aspergillus sergii]